jgi:hypothetical protein
MAALDADSVHHHVRCPLDHATANRGYGTATCSQRLHPIKHQSCGGRGEVHHSAHEQRHSEHHQQVPQLSQPLQWLRTFTAESASPQ